MISSSLGALKNHLYTDNTLVFIFSPDLFPYARFVSNFLPDIYIWMCDWHFKLSMSQTKLICTPQGTLITVLPLLITGNSILPNQKTPSFSLSRPTSNPLKKNPLSPSFRILVYPQSEMSPCHILPEMTLLKHMPSYATFLLKSSMPSHLTQNIKVPTVVCEALATLTYLPQPPLPLLRPQFPRSPCFSDTALCFTRTRPARSCLGVFAVFSPSRNLFPHLSA